MLILAMLAAVSCADDDDNGQPQPQPISFSFEQAQALGVNLPYRKAEINKDKDSKAALVLYLHGGSSKGSDNTAQMGEPAVETITEYLSGQGIKSVFLVPQCPSDKSWGGTMNGVLKSLIDTYVANGTVDASQVYIFGGSMGGTGTWSMVSSYPGVFAAAMPVAGDPSKCDAAKVAATPVLTVMGTADTIMDLDKVSVFVEGLKAQGGTARMDTEQDWTHEDVCEKSYTKERLDWVFGNK